MKNAFLMVATFAAMAVSSSSADRRYENLGNPTEYLFSHSVSEIRGGLEALQGRNLGPIRGGFDRDGGFGFYVMEYYTTRYWTGRREKAEEVDPPEAGRIGTINASFEVRWEPVGDKCLVRVMVREFKQQVGRKYSVFPHFRKTPRDIEVKSDTFFEYFFLLKLGEKVGEKNMPVLKGNAEPEIEGK